MSILLADCAYAECARLMYAIPAFHWGENRVSCEPQLAASLGLEMFRLA